MFNSNHWHWPFSVNSSKSCSIPTNKPLELSIIFPATFWHGSKDMRIAVWKQVWKKGHHQHDGSRQNNTFQSIYASLNNLSSGKYNPVLLSYDDDDDDWWLMMMTRTLYLLILLLTSILFFPCLHYRLLAGTNVVHKGSWHLGDQSSTFQKKNASSYWELRSSLKLHNPPERLWPASCRRNGARRGNYLRISSSYVGRLSNITEGVSGN